MKTRKYFGKPLPGYHEPLTFFTGLPVRPRHKMDFRSSAAKNGLPGEGRHEGLVPRNDVLTNGFIGFSLARTLAQKNAICVVRSDSIIGVTL